RSRLATHPDRLAGPNLASKGRVECFSNEVFYEGDGGKQGRPGTTAHPRGAKETGRWARRDIGSCSCGWCHSLRIDLVSHNTHEIRKRAHAHRAGTRIFGSHH